MAYEKRIGILHRRCRVGSGFGLCAYLGVRYGFCKVVSLHSRLKGKFQMEQKANESEQNYRTGQRAWYVIHTYSGYENKVKANLDKKIVAQNLGDVIFDVVVPMRTESEFKDNKRRSVRRKIFPGYVLVDMIVNNYSWFVVRNTQGVTGFVGSEKDPIPLTAEEAEKILEALSDNRPAEMPIEFEVNDRVRIVSGLFENRIAFVKSIDPVKRRVKVLVENAPVDLDVSQIEKA